MKATFHDEARPRLLTVKTMGETFGLPIARVQTAFIIAAVTPIPLGPAAVVGLVNLRGAVIPALSLRRRLGLPDHASPIGALAVGLDSGNDAFALLVDEVGDVITVEADTLRPLPPHVNDTRAALTLAFHHLEGGILPVLDVSALMLFEVENGAAAIRRRVAARGRAPARGGESSPRTIAHGVS